MEQKHIVALETGSSKIRGAIGSVDADGILTVMAVEEERLSDGVRYGWVRNVAEVSQAIDKILSRLEDRVPGRHITGLYAAVGGKSTMLSTCVIERRLPVDTEITTDHIRDIAEEARATVINERDIIAVTPRKYIIDNNLTVNPVGIYGRNIEATYNLVRCRSQLTRNLRLVVSKSGRDLNGLVVRQLALANLVLSHEEKRLGCMLVDFGAETVTVSLYRKGILRYLATLPMGSRNITRDITSLNHLEENAERLKRNVGNAEPLSGSSADRQAISADHTEVNNLVSARAGEIIANINEQIKYADLTPESLPAGIVVVGGGAKLKGFNARLERVTGLKVRSGMPDSSVRITDSRIQPVDAVDVIAILAAVAAKGRSCLSEPEPEPEEISRQEETVAAGHIPTIGDNDRKKQPVNLPAPDDNEDEEVDDFADADEPGSSKFKQWADSMRRRMARLVEIRDDDDDLDDGFDDRR